MLIVWLARQRSKIRGVTQKNPRSTSSGILYHRPMKPFPTVIVAFTFSQTLVHRRQGCIRLLLSRLHERSPKKRLCISSLKTTVISNRGPTELHYGRPQKENDLRNTNVNKAIVFSFLLILSGAILGPLLDSYHSAFGVLHYHSPFSLQLWGGTGENVYTTAVESSSVHIEPPALITTYWVPLLFGLAGFIIGWMYILLDFFIPEIFRDSTFLIPMKPQFHAHAPIILCGIACFTFQYWLSGYFFANTGMDRSAILIVMSVYAALGYVTLDKTLSGFITSVATALGGPLIEMFLIELGRDSTWGYEYTDTGETGFFPLWILPVYFLGGSAVGNLARGLWKALLKPETVDVE